ncbi:MAG: DEAD/DEAH box helicase, partial [Gammaproteobacteria bacterium]|nr:DEAD/DEAH box helicase [Gammaproteobacteria bacterium]
METVWRIAVPVPLYTLFDYLPVPGASTPTPGCRVRVPFGRHSRIGCLLEVVEGSAIDHARLKTATAVLDNSPLLRPEDLALLKWAARYYHHPPGEVLAAALPGLLRRGRSADAGSPQFLALTENGLMLALDTLSRAPRQALLLRALRDAAGHRLAAADLSAAMPGWRRAAEALVARRLAEFGGTLQTVPAACAPLAWSGLDARLNPAQVQAVDRVARSFGQHATFLLEGVTGSGKTEVYLNLVRLAAARGEQTLLLLPEISLTPQIEERFRAGLDGAIGVFHSRLTESERLQSWLGAQRGTARVLLGTRSAVFVPLRRPGLIVVDEEHDPSYKQQEGFRFSARDVAIKRAHELGIPIVLGSATPCLESLWNAQRGR